MANTLKIWDEINIYRHFNIGSLFLPGKNFTQLQPISFDTKWKSFALLHCCHILNCQRVLFKTLFFCYNLQLYSFHLSIIKRKQRSFLQNYNEIFISIWVSLTHSLRANETKIWGFKIPDWIRQGLQGKTKWTFLFEIWKAIDWLFY